MSDIDKTIAIEGDSSHNKFTRCPVCGAEMHMRADHHNSLRCPVCNFVKKAQTTFAPGSVVLNKYRILSLLNGGSFGDIFICHPLTDVSVRYAIKVLKNTCGNSLPRFRREAEVLSSLNDEERIARIIDFWDEDDCIVIVMEYVQGVNLKQAKKEYDFDEYSVWQIAREVVIALKNIWESHNIIHRDIKPENIMFDRSGTVKILDLGLSKISGDRRLNQKSITGSLTSLGTVQYMAPEQAVDAANCDSRADIYSMGVTLYQFCTGKLPFESEDRNELRRMHAQDKPLPPSAHVKNIDPKMEQIILRCLEKRREDRYSSISALALDLEAVLKNRILPSTLDQDRRFPGKDFCKKKFPSREQNSWKKYCRILPGGIILCALLLAGSVFLLKNLSSGKKERAETERNRVPTVTPEQVLETLAKKAVRLAEENKFEEAARVFTNYNGPFAEETRAKRLLLAQGYRISGEFLLKESLSGAKADTDSDRNQ